MTEAAPGAQAGVLIRSLQDGDWPRVREIYAAGMDTGIATFEIEVPSAGDLDAKWLQGQRWVAVDAEGCLIGWAALTAVSGRPCYRGVAETSVYVDPAAAGRGVGRALVRHQLVAAVGAGFWTLQASVFAENRASLSVHQAEGFREVGVRERIAQRDGRWHDTVLLEYRSPTR